MTNTDMIGWLVEDGVGEVRDLYSTSRSIPGKDEIQNLTQDAEPSLDDNGFVTFVTRRPLDTGDADKDFIVALDTEI